MKQNIIEVVLNSKKDYISQFHDKKISKELSDYILNESKAFKPNEKLEIHVFSNNMSSEEKHNFIDMVRENYGIDIRELCILSEKKNISNLLCLLFGIIALFLNLLVDIIPIVSEFVLIFGWVLIWEGIYNMLFDGLKTRMMIKRLKKLTSCKIKFIEKK